ncbi:MAG: two-component sensor histidine kinase [Deltaproteobacteria bacterium]|nr:two-component sensor histidine kinase [Deltaproteobacteria bacterium]MBW2067639.1 two-component sensor histidine kinase [Deltaproteobacteria bacterium]
MSFLKNKFWTRLQNFFTFRPEKAGEARYVILRRNLAVTMILVTFVPLFLMAFINYVEYRATLHKEILSPMQSLVGKAKHSLELFIAERVATVSFVSKAYSFEELADPQRLSQIFSVMKTEFQGFVDLGIINEKGIQINYVGPYQLLGKDYSEQPWFHEVRVKGSYVSDVFLGYRKFPHMVVAVESSVPGGKSWIVRATIDTDRLNDVILSMSLDPESDAFLINREGILQTPSKFYGNVLDRLSFPIPSPTYQPSVVSLRDDQGRELFMSYAFLREPNLILVMVKPKVRVLKAWTTLKSEMLVLFVGGTLIVLFVVIKITGIFVNRIKEADEKREAAFRELQHHHKLSSLGRLAAGVAHEINNPMAIINEKAGLILDLLPQMPQSPYRDRLETLTRDILKSVDRCRNITHRLLGFARRMDVQIEVLDLNEVVREVLTFLEKEALYRNIDVRLQLAENLPRIASDRGQLQQVFLNILNNAFEAVPDGGIVSITSWEVDADKVAVSIQDNGHGMDEETMKHIFEPFFTTKKSYGTGLGLPITYGIVKKLGGDIQVQSHVGEGTTFTVYLPKKAPHAE